jgi:6-phosphogluconolactonase
VSVDADKVKLLRFPNAAELARAAATAWVDELMRRDTGRDYTVALPGGRIATAFMAAAVELIRARGLSLAGVHFFWADERCVPPSSPDSNFALAQAALFQPLAVPAEQIHRLRGEADPEFAVAEADAELCRLAELRADGMPVLDLVFLGLGEDGHVASLFPNASQAVIAARGPFLHVTDSPKPPSLRITVSYPVLFVARRVWVLASGAGKEAALRASLAPGGRTPLGRVLAARPATRVFTDIAL